MKCPKGDGELRHSSPSTQLGIKSKYTSLVYVCDVCHGVWVESPHVASLKRQQIESRSAGQAEHVQCPSCHKMVVELVDAGPDFPGSRMCAHCTAILKYETLHFGRRTI